MENEVKIDLRKALDVDLTASISLLSMIKDDPQLFERVLTILEEYQEQLIKKQQELDTIE
jgi:hypothetical protein